MKTSKYLKASVVAATLMGWATVGVAGVAGPASFIKSDSATFDITANVEAIAQIRAVGPTGSDVTFDGLSPTNGRDNPDFDASVCLYSNTTGGLMIALSSGHGSYDLSHGQLVNELDNTSVIPYMVALKPLTAGAGGMTLNFDNTSSGPFLGSDYLSQTPCDNNGGTPSAMLGFVLSINSASPMHPVGTYKDTLTVTVTPVVPA